MQRRGHGGPRERARTCYARRANLCHCPTATSQCEALCALAVESFLQMLAALKHLFEKAEEAAVTKKLELAKLASARLAQDMYPFSMQVQLAC